MATFVGTFEHSLDDKGRVVVPSPFRARLADGAVLAKLERNLALWTPDSFDERLEDLRDQVGAGHLTNDELRIYLAEAAEVKPDAQGRIWLPNTLRLHARLETQVVFLGFGSRIEIWNDADWRGTSRTGDDRVVEHLETVGR